MTSYKEALQKVLKVSKKNKKKQIANTLNNEVLAENITAKRNNPYYNNSLLDGFAFKSSDTSKNSFFKICGELAVGENKKINYIKNHCYRISTGGKIIAPFDCMLPYEQVEIIDGLVQISSKVKKYQNVRLEGSDFKKGNLLIRKNEKLSPAKKLLIKSSGNKIVSTYEKPNIVLFCSGDEITDTIVDNEKIKAAELDYESAVETLKSEYSAYYPQVTITIGNEWEDDRTPAKGTHPANTITHDSKQGIKKSITITQMIWDAGRTSSVIDKAKSTAQQANYRLELAKEDVVMEAINAWLNLQKAYNTHEANKKVEANAKITLAMTIEKVKKGEASKLEQLQIYHFVSW